MNRLEYAKKKREEEAKKGRTVLEVVDQTKQIEALESVKDELGVLNELIGKIDNRVDLGPLLEQIKALADKVDLKEEFAVLKQVISEYRLDNKMLEKLTKAIEDVKPVPVKTKQDDIYDVYKPSDSDEEFDTPKYYGFLAKDGRWFIMRENGIEKKNWRYASGTKDYGLKWESRKGLSYVTFDKVVL